MTEAQAAATDRAILDVAPILMALQACLARAHDVPETPELKEIRAHWAACAEAASDELLKVLVRPATSQAAQTAKLHALIAYAPEWQWPKDGAPAGDCAEWFLASWLRDVAPPHLVSRWPGLDKPPSVTHGN